jgi:hypothetical protein
MLSRNCPPTRNSPVRTVIDPALIPAVRWNNGGGVTREVAASPPGQDPPDQHMLPPRINRTSEVLDCRPPQNALSRGAAPNITRILADVGKPSRQVHVAQ